MRRTAWIALFLLPMATCTPDGAERDAAYPGSGSEASGAGGESPAPREDARAAVGAFHRALSQADSATAVSLLHPDATIYESGHAETVEEYRAGHLPADIRFAAATEREVLSERSVALGGHVLYLAETRVHGRMGERDIDSNGVETMVLEPGPDGWRIRHIHWSNR